MAYDPKKKVQSILRKAKRQARKVRPTAITKKIYLEAQARKMDKNPTAPEAAFEEILKSLNIPYTSQKIVGGKIYDFYSEKYNVLFEVDGCYWHGNPDKYAPEDLNNIQKKTIREDKKKDIIAKGYGYKILRFWETDIHKNPQKVIDSLKNLMLITD